MTINSDVVPNKEAAMKARIWNQFMISSPSSIESRETFNEFYVDVDAVAYNTGIARNVREIDLRGGSVYPKTVSMSSQSDVATTVYQGQRSSPDPFDSLIPQAVPAFPDA